MHEKQLRIRYIRVLEKFFTRTLSLLKLENFDYELFSQRVEKNLDDLNRVKKVDLNSPYYIKLHDFVDKTLQYAKNGVNIEDTRNSLLKEANLLQKEKKRNSYSKDKHKQHKFNDEY